jgi:hypothetical protein
MMRLFSHSLHDGPDDIRLRGLGATATVRPALHTGRMLLLREII